MRLSQFLAPVPKVIVGTAVFIAVFVISLAVGCGLPPRTATAPGASGNKTAPVAPVPLPRQIVSADQLTQFVGSAQCISCHPDQAGQLQSRHARTLARTNPQLHGVRFRKSPSISDPLEGIDYKTAIVGDRCVLKAFDGAKESEASADFAFGSGGIGVTYVNRRAGVSTELRLSHYTVPGIWDFTPGQRVGRKEGLPVGVKLSAKTERACFSCHSTVLAEEGGALNLDRSTLGIGCESCHGAGAAHIEAVKGGATDLRMADLSGVRQRVSLEACGSCHRQPGSVDLGNAGMASQLPRLQPVALSFSGCFKKGGASCMTCHDPHKNADSKRLVDYERICASCHSSVSSGQVLCKAQHKDGCVSCHMPKQSSGMPGDVRFRNHWIKVWK